MRILNAFIFLCENTAFKIRTALNYCQVILHAFSRLYVTDYLKITQIIELIRNYKFGGSCITCLDKQIREITEIDEFNINLYFSVIFTEMFEKHKPQNVLNILHLCTFKMPILRQVIF